MNLPPRSILACADFSAASDAALERAADLAFDFGARLTLLHVVPTSLWSDAGRRFADLAGFQPPQVDEVRQAMREGLQQRAQALMQRRNAAMNETAQVTASGPREAWQVVVGQGRVATEIARVAAEVGADLMVVGAHGAHALASAWVGTTAQRLLRTAPCPVLVVKRLQPVEYATVLLPTDFSAPATAAARAARMLWPRGVFHVVHAYELPYEGLMAYAGASEESVAYYRAQAEQRLHAELKQLIATTGLPSGRAVAHVRHGYPPTLIDEWARRLRADLVVIANHGKSDLEALFLGGVSAHIVASARCDVLLVRERVAP